jgi:hypothetical protein
MTPTKTAIAKTIFKPSAKERNVDNLFSIKGDR